MTSETSERAQGYLDADGDPDYRDGLLPFTEITIRRES